MRVQTFEAALEALHAGDGGRIAGIHRERYLHEDIEGRHTNKLREVCTRLQYIYTSVV